MDKIRNRKEITVPLRIVIFGRPGSGKTTLANNMGRITNITVYQLDKIRWKYENNKWLPISDEESYEHYKSILDHPQWIIDGNYISTLQDRCKHAHRIVYINVPRWKCLLRIFMRRFHGEKLNLNWGFIKYVWNYDNLIHNTLHDLRLSDKFIEINNDD